MGDVVMCALVVVFFIVCAGYVSWCGRVIGPDPERADAATAELEPVTADR